MPGMAAARAISFRGFPVIRQELEEIVTLLKSMPPPEKRVRLLRELRLLIEEADSLHFEAF
jgi:hypothetical protein